MNESDAYDALVNIESEYINYIDYLRYIMTNAVAYTTDYVAYLSKMVYDAHGSLQSIINQHSIVFTQDYLDRAQSYLDELNGIEITAENDEKLTNLINEINDFWGKGGDNLNLVLLDKGTEEANAFPAFLASASNAAINNLKTSIRAWDFNKTKVAAQAVITAEKILLQDKPKKQQTGTKVTVTKPVKASEISSVKSTVKTTKAAKTGDESNGAMAGLLVLISLAGIAGVVVLKKKKTLEA